MWIDTNLELRNHTWRALNVITLHFNIDTNAIMLSTIFPKSNIGLGLPLLPPHTSLKLYSHVVKQILLIVSYAVSGSSREPTC